jgi:hypothetical protein
MTYPFKPGTGAGKRAEAAKPEPKPEVKPISEGSPPLPTFYAGHTKGYPPSAGRAELAPAFERFSVALSKELERDRRERELTIKEAFGPTNELLAEQVRAGDIDELTARELWDAAHPGMKPEDLR